MADKPDPDAFLRVFVIIMNRLPHDFQRPYTDATPLRDLLPGIWPTWGDLKLLVERTPTKAIEDPIIRDAIIELRKAGPRAEPQTFVVPVPDLIERLSAAGKHANDQMARGIVVDLHIKWLSVDVVAMVAGRSYTRSVSWLDIAEAKANLLIPAIDLAVDFVRKGYQHG